MEDNDLKHRVRIVRLDQDTLLSIFRAVAEPHEYMLAPEFIDLPKGYEVLAVHDNTFRCRSFDFKVRHIEFPPVPEGEMIPVIKSRVECKRTLYKLSK